MCDQPNAGCHGTTYEMASLCLLLNSFSFLGASVEHTKKPTHDITAVVGFTSRSLQSRWPVGIGANRKGQLPYILIPIGRSLFQTADRRTHSSCESPLARASTA